MPQPELERDPLAALEHVVAVLRGESASSGRGLVLVTDCPHLAVAAASILLASATARAWVLVHLDTPADGARAASTARGLLRCSSRMRPGAAYSVARASCSFVDELMHPGPVVGHLDWRAGLAERVDDGTTLLVNGDNWRHAPGGCGSGHGLYPAVACVAALEAALAEQDGLQATQVLAVPGGIAAAFELVCAAFSLTDGHALLVGPAYFGIERTLATRGILPRLVPPSASGQLARDVVARVGPSTRMVVLTHPALYTCDDMSEVLAELTQTMQQYAILVVDECYTAYAQQASSVRHVLTASVTVVGLRGLSKAHGLAALRLAYTVSNSRTARRLRAAACYKTCAEPVAREALRHLRARPVIGEVRAQCAIRDAIVAALREKSVLATGAGPYVLVASRTPAGFADMVRGLERAGIRVSLDAAPLVVYQPATEAWNARFCRAVQSV